MLHLEINIKQLATAFALLLLSAVSRAQIVPQADLSFEYSHFFIATGSKVNMDGGSFSGAYNIDEWVGLVGDLGVYQGSQAGAGVTGITYMFGTRISYRKPERVVPFIQGLGGGSHFSNRLGGPFGPTNAFSYAFGGGVDIALGQRGKLMLRPHVEYVGFRYSINAARFSIGLVYHIRGK